MLYLREKEGIQKYEFNYSLSCKGCVHHNITLCYTPILHVIGGKNSLLL